MPDCSRRLRALLLIAAVVVLAGCGGAAPLVESTPLQADASDGPPRVDGDVGEWAGAMAPVEGAPLTLGVRNDGEALYLALASSDPDLVRHVFLTGLVVWIDAEGGKGTERGVHYPLGLVRDGQLPDVGMLRGGRGGDDAERAERFAAMLEDVAVIEDGEAVVYDRASLTDAEVAARMVAGTFTLEMRLPLQQGDLFAVGARPGAEVGVGVETPELDRGALRAQARERMGQRGGRVGGMRGGAGGLRGAGVGGGQRPSPPEPVEAWVRVALAD